MSNEFSTISASIGSPLGAASSEYPELQTQSGSTALDTIGTSSLELNRRSPLTFGVPTASGASLENSFQAPLAGAASTYQALNESVIELATSIVRLVQSILSYALQVVSRPSDSLPGTEAGGKDAGTATGGTSTPGGPAWGSGATCQPKPPVPPLCTEKPKDCQCPAGTTVPPGTPPATTPPATTPRVLLPFAEKLKQIFGNAADKTVNEAELQYGIAAFQLYQKSDEAEASFQKGYKAAIASGKTVPEATKQGLLTARNEGKIAGWEAEWVYSLSFRAAQLDKSLDSLSNAARGNGRHDLASALRSGELGLVRIQGGTVKVTPRGFDLFGDNATDGSQKKSSAALDLFGNDAERNNAADSASVQG